MLRFTKRADYGLMAIHYIATHDGRGAVSAKRIAEEFGIPPELLANLFVFIRDNIADGQASATARPADFIIPLKR